MKIVYNTNQNKIIHLQMSKTEYVLYPDEMVDVDCSEQETVLYISTKKTAKMNIGRMIGLLLRRIILNIINIIIMNYNSDWLADVDPFILSATYKSKYQTLFMRYIPAKISKNLINVEEPQLIINDELIKAKIEPDINAIKYGFIKWCFDLVSFWLYSILLLTFIFLYSGKFLIMFAIFVLLLAVITTPIILKIKKAYSEKQKLLNYFGKKELE